MAYRILSLMGKGSFGTAHLAQCEDDGECYVVKQLKSVKKDDITESVKEARVLSLLDHPNILKYKDSFIEPNLGVFCIVTEWCEGGDLQKVCLSARDNAVEGKIYFSEDHVLRWFVQLTMALQYIHSRHILHRDLKTGNIFLRKGTIKIGDFGIAKMLDCTQDMAQTFAGTPYYMSPEVLQNQAYNSKSDIWALGCILYELCTLHPAFFGDNLMGIMYKIIEGQTPEVSDQYSSELRQLIKDLLQKKPENRPSASEILKRPFIKKWLGEFMKAQIEAAAKAAAQMQTINTTTSDQAHLPMSGASRLHLQHQHVTSNTHYTKSGPVASANNASSGFIMTPRQSHPHQSSSAASAAALQDDEDELPSDTILFAPKRPQTSGIANTDVGAPQSSASQRGAIRGSALQNPKVVLQTQSTPALIAANNMNILAGAAGGSGTSDATYVPYMNGQLPMQQASYLLQGQNPRSNRNTRSNSAKARNNNNNNSSSNANNTDDFAASSPKGGDKGEISSNLTPREAMERRKRERARLEEEKLKNAARMNFVEKQINKVRGRNVVLGDHVHQHMHHSSSPGSLGAAIGGGGGGGGGGTHHGSGGSATLSSSYLDAGGGHGSLRGSRESLQDVSYSGRPRPLSPIGYAPLKKSNSVSPLAPPSPTRDKDGDEMMYNGGYFADSNQTGTVYNATTIKQSSVPKLHPNNENSNNNTNNNYNNNNNNNNSQPSNQTQYRQQHPMKQQSEWALRSRNVFLNQTQTQSANYIDDTLQIGQRTLEFYLADVTDASRERLMNPQPKERAANRDNANSAASVRIAKTGEVINRGLPLMSTSFLPVLPGPRSALVTSSHDQLLEEIVNEFYDEDDFEQDDSDHEDATSSRINPSSSPSKASSTRSSVEKLPELVAGSQNQPRSRRSSASSSSSSASSPSPHVLPFASSTSQLSPPSSLSPASSICFADTLKVEAERVLLEHERLALAAQEALEEAAYSSREELPVDIEYRRDREMQERVFQKLESDGETTLGKELFWKVVDYLRENEENIRNGQERNIVAVNRYLRKLVGEENYRHCMIAEKLVFLQESAR